MCLITFAYNFHPGYKLVLAANRDEFYKRTARPAQFWKEEGFPGLLAGKDLQAGGTWFGATRSGKWAALTNYRDLDNIKEGAPSRGDLVTDFLKSNLTAREYLSEILEDADDYNGFNLLLSDGNELLHYANESNRITLLPPGIYGISNALLDTPWPKVLRAKNKLNQLLKEEDMEFESLFDILKDKTPADLFQLPQTGLSLEQEQAVSSLFIQTPVYGTRCSTLLTIDNDDETQFIERSYASSSGRVIGEVKFKFEMEDAF